LRLKRLAEHADVAVTSEEFDRCFVD
jgi:hypothetical protein